jgi:hypothetical protein
MVREAQLARQSREVVLTLSQPLEGDRKPQPE